MVCECNKYFLEETFLDFSLKNVHILSLKAKIYNFSYK